MTEDELKKLWLIDENHNALYTPVNPVEKFDEVTALAAQMFDIMKQSNGVGLSANQIGVDARMFVMRWPAIDGEEGGEFTVINPKIVKASSETIVYEEGCLSFPGLYIHLTRPESIDVEFQNQEGKTEQHHLKGWAARIFQHEYDHMDGITFRQRASRLKLEKADKKRVKLINKIVQRR